MMSLLFYRNHYGNRFGWINVLCISFLMTGCLGSGTGGSGSNASPIVGSNLNVSPVKVSIAVNATANLNATESAADGTVVNISNPVKWASSDASVVSVGANSGILTGISAGGPVVITAKVDGLTATANVVVTAVGGIAGTSLAVARNDHTASLIANGPNTGKVLVVGGYGNSSVSNTTLNALDSVEMYDPATATWTTVAPLYTARGDHTSVTLQSGQVLVTSGTDSSSTQLTSTELYDPTTATGSWASSCNLNFGRTYNTITLLQSGKVLVAGGDTLLGTSNTAEVYDPAVASSSFLSSTSCTWTQAASMSVPRNTQTATLLKNGFVLIAGGFNVFFDVNPLGILTVFTSSELYDPINDSWTLTGSLKDGRYQHTATLLNDGKVLVVGGYSAGSPALATAELYDPTTGLWTATGSLATARTIHSAALLPNGQVLVMGGLDSSGNPLTSNELYDPTVIDTATGRMGTWTTTSSFVNARDNFTATLLPADASHPNGSVLASGGDGVTNIINSSELYWW